MQFTDTHTHLYMPEFEADDNGAGAVKRAIEGGVTRMVFPNVSLSTIASMKALAARFPSNVRMAMGLQPTEVKDDWPETTAAVLDELGDGTQYVALGEVGIDLYWDKTYEQEQMQSLERQITRAKELGLPVIIHCREGLDQVLEVMKEFPGVEAVFHSFGGTRDDVERIRNVGDYYFGINGIVTFKNSKLREVLPEITTDRLLLETDSPYLAPVPHRGKRNESGYIVHTAAHIATYLNIPLEQLAEKTNANAERMFGAFT